MLLFRQFGAALKITYLFGCFRGTLAVSKVLAIPTLLVETARTRSHHTFIRKY